MSFVHLHVHSEFSLLDGLSRIPRLVKRAAELDMPAMALTDHGAMFGAISFYKAAHKAGIKPIIGMETYLAARGMNDRDPKQDSRSHHLLLLAENQTGYRNLLKIASVSQLEGFYYRPRIDHEFLAAHSEGLICTTGCMSGEVPRTLLTGNIEKAQNQLDWYLDVFSQDRFFFELQHHDIPELPEVNKNLIELGHRYNANFIATNDVHYVLPEDSDLQDILLCIQTGAVRTDPNRMRMTDPSYYLRTPQEMQKLFGEVPKALENTLWIAERCEVDLDFKGYRLPHFEVPEGHTPDTYLRSLCEAGLVKRFGSRADDPVYRERLNYELGIIHQMGFDTYFLIVWDLCRYARELDIWYNARGSAAGSIVAYCLEITLVDPIEHELIFERFLNPGRVSMPDIDLDFQDDQRFKLLEYTSDKYGKDKVAQIITFGTLGARAAIRDVGRVLDVPLPEVDRVAKLVPNIPGKPVTIQEALGSVHAFQELYSELPYMRELVDVAARLEGVARNAGTHAAGVIITDKPITEYIPLHRPTSGSQEDNPIGAVTQFEMNVLDSLGLLKIDFLGLSTLTVMARACRMIRDRHGVDLDISSIPLDDEETYRLLGRGEVLGIFQVEGAGMRRNLMEMKPRELANVVAMVALYRPGPMEKIPDYIRRMHGQEEISYLHPKLEPILRETFGITVYQEQIMYTAMHLAGYTASEADDLRKAVAKKKAEALRDHRHTFVAGATSNDVPEHTANIIFDQWETFARYGFPKGHAADYAVICVQTAYLKAHFPLEYMTALLSVFKHDSDKVALYIADCRRMGFDVLPPDIKVSGLDFTIEDRQNKTAAIRFGLGAVKNVGEGAITKIIEVRAKIGSFSSLGDFARKVDLRQVGKRALESLVKVGALDAFGPRIAMLDSLERILSLSTQHFRAIEVGQMSFFGAESGVSDAIELSSISSDVPRRRQLTWEKELLGVYVSDHPMTPHMEDLARVVSHYSVELGDADHGQAVCVAGEVAHIRPYQTRSGKSMGFVTIEDLQGTIELVLFNRIWKEVASWLTTDSIVLAEGRIDRERGEPKVLVDKLTKNLKQVPSAVSAVNIHDNDVPIDQAAPVYEPTLVSGSVYLEPTLEHDETPDPEPVQVSPPQSEVREATSEPASHVRPPSVSESSLGEIPETPPPIIPSGFEDKGEPPKPVLVGEEGPESLEEIRKVIEERPGLPASEDLMTPSVFESPEPTEAQVVIIILRSTGDRRRDTLRMRRVHGLLSSYPGSDRFTFHVFESSRRYHLEFPSSTTGYCPELHAQLIALLGEGAVRVEPLRIQ